MYSHLQNICRTLTPRPAFRAGFGYRMSYDLNTTHFTLQSQNGFVFRFTLGHAVFSGVVLPPEVEWLGEVRSCECRDGRERVAERERGS